MKHPSSFQRLHALRHRQRGVTLIELMVGLFIGLMVVGVAGAALMASRGISGTVSDAAGVQQQAAYAMRVIGQQTRQTGSLYLDLNSSDSAASAADGLSMAAVGFQLLGSLGGVIDGDDSKLDINYTRYTEPTFTGPAEISQVRNCLGGPADSSTDQSIENVFELDDTDLKCKGNGVDQPIIGNVRDFQVRYLVQDNRSSLGDAKITYAKAEDVNDLEDGWANVQGVEVCLVLFGDERIDIPSTSTYKGCDGSDLSFTENKMHLLFRNVFQLRSQGLVRRS